MSCLAASRFLQYSLPAAALLAAVVMSGCATSTKTSEPVAVAPAVELPAAAAPAAELVPLTFMAGRWICVNPNKTVNEEHWTMPRGNSMYALFRQMRRDGKPALVEVTQVSVEKDGVELRLRHLHAGLEIPKNRETVDLFKLTSTGENTATFTAQTGAGTGMTVTYRKVTDTQLAMDVKFPEGSKEKPYSLNYTKGE